MRVQEINLNVADNQTQNLNYNPRNPNLTNPGSKKFARDYDKEPLIIKSYEDFFVETLFFMPLVFSIIITIFIMGWVEDKSIDNILSLVIALACIACWMIIDYFFYVIKKKDTVHFMNDSVKFYENGILKHTSSLKNLDELICKPLDASMPNKGVRDTTLYIIVLCGFFGMSGSLLFVVLFVIFMYLGNIIIKIFFQLATQGNLSGFTPFPAIIIDEPHYPNVKFVTYYHALCKKYFIIFIFDKDKYAEIKTYFLDRKNINIDEVKKYYLP